MDHQRVQTLPSWASLLFLGAVVVFSVSVSVHALTEHYTVPYGDDWRILDYFFSQPLFHWIFAAQNGHRLPGTLTLFALDYWAFGGSQSLLVAAGLANLWLAAAAFKIALAPRLREAEPLAITVFAFCCFFLFWGATRHDLVWGMNQGTLMAVMWACTAFLSLALYLERLRNGDRTRAARWVLLSALSAAAATFSQGIGYATWAGVLTIAVVGRSRPRVVVALCLGAFATLLLFTSGPEEHGGGALDRYVEFMVGVPMQLADSVLQFVGAPLAAITSALGLAHDLQREMLARAWGASGVLVFVPILAMGLLHPEKVNRRHLLSIGLAVSALIGGLMVALNRTWLPSTAVDARFATWSSLFWIGLAAAIPPAPPRVLRVSLGVIASLVLVIVAAAAFLALDTPRAAQQNLREHLSQVRAMHLLDIQWDVLARGSNLNPNPERSYRVAARLREDRKSIFRDPLAALPGAALTNRVKLAEPGRCAGRIVAAHRLDTRSGDALRVLGSAIDTAREEPVEAIVIVDTDGLVQGLGTHTRRATGKTLPRRRPLGFPFTAFLRGSVCSGHVAYGLIEDGALACHIADLEESLPPDCKKARRGRQAHFIP